MEGAVPESRRIISLSGSIAERRAVKCGFNVAQISTPQFRTAGSSCGWGGGCPPCHLTISPGISPTALLDSPIMLPNSQALSPTTGTISFPLFLEESTVMSSEDDQESDEGNSSFPIKPDMAIFSDSCFPDQGTDAFDGDFIDGSSLMNFDMQASLPTSDYEKTSHVNSSYSEEAVYGAAAELKPTTQTGFSEANSDNKEAKVAPTPTEKEFVQVDDVREPRGSYDSLGPVKTAEDGYNWRKYGQKQVKGSEYPRSYYKCTNPNCQVKKKVERSHDGQITEIIYKGAHNHPKPQPPRRGGGSTSALGAALSLAENVPDIGEGAGAEGGDAWRNAQLGVSNKDVRPDGLEDSSPTSIRTSISDILSAAPHGRGVGNGSSEPAHGPELSSSQANHEDDEDGGGGLASLEEAEDEEPDSKRRKSEHCLVESSMASRAVREPRVVIQIESEIDILEDGYRWRKYGQKVVKGNPNPRSYYKCTSAGCLVRKHVERASHDLKFVVTTYEGKHNHGVPAARNAGNGNPGGGGTMPPPPPHSQSSALAIPKNPNMIFKSESQVHQDLMLFDQKPDFGAGADFFRHTGLITNFGPSSVYPMKFPHLQSCGSGLAAGPSPIPQGRPMVSVVPEFPSSVPFKFNRPSGIPLASLDYANAKAAGLVRPFPSGNPIKEEDPRFLTPKQELKDDHFYDSSFPIMEPTSALPGVIFPQALISFP
ncbi:hypothetical protein SAY86_008344 [Trapa natans]|uniref:WRKY domain-containing protein n=1 Tax=Trapa natans TaxID=22666 RepID=A0AAN7KEK2_TRANT|nr:hypothetical protein SAY86_008344 [Trapa natans]